MKDVWYSACDQTSKKTIRIARNSQARSSAIRIRSERPVGPDFGLPADETTSGAAIGPDLQAMRTRRGIAARFFRATISLQGESGTLLALVKVLVDVGIVDIGLGHDREAGADRRGHRVAGDMGIGRHEAEIADL